MQVAHSLAHVRAHSGQAAEATDFHAARVQGQACLTPAAAAQASSPAVDQPRVKPVRHSTPCEQLSLLGGVMQAHKLRACWRMIIAREAANRARCEVKGRRILMLPLSRASDAHAGTATCCGCGRTRCSAPASISPPTASPSAGGPQVAPLVRCPWLEPHSMVTRAQIRHTHSSGSIELCTTRSWAFWDP